MVTNTIASRASCPSLSTTVLYSGPGRGPPPVRAVATSATSISSSVRSDGRPPAHSVATWSGRNPDRKPRPACAYISYATLKRAPIVKMTTCRARPDSPGNCWARLMKRPSGCASSGKCSITPHGPTNAPWLSRTSKPAYSSPSTIASKVLYRGCCSELRSAGRSSGSLIDLLPHSDMLLTFKEDGHPLFFRLGSWASNVNRRGRTAHAAGEPAVQGRSASRDPGRGTRVLRPQRVSPDAHEGRVRRGRQARWRRLPVLPQEGGHDRGRRRPEPGRCHRGAAHRAEPQRW